MYKILTQTKNFINVGWQMLPLQNEMSRFTPVSHFAPSYPTKIIFRRLQHINH